MSSGFWQTKRQTEQFGTGYTTTQAVNKYVGTWERRCYQGGIPDEVPKRLADGGRVPSWKAIALCILRNDLQLRALGFGRQDSQIVDAIYQTRKK